jgi:hypothetical protein
MKMKSLSVLATLIFTLLLTSCGGSGTESSSSVETEEVTEEIDIEAKLDAEWQELVAEKPELTARCEPFIKYRLGRNEVLSQGRLLASIAASQAVVDATGNINIDVKIRLTRERQQAERQEATAIYWFNPWDSEVENLIISNKKLANECNFTNDELIDNMR